VIRKGEEWGTPAGNAAPDLDISGDDAALAAALAGAGPDPLVRFTPAEASDLARAVGLVGEGAGALAVPVDVLRLGDGGLAVNAVVVGVPPDELRAWHRAVPFEVVVDGKAVDTSGATTVVIANGQFLRGNDVSPRGHPGDGWCEVQVYAVPPGQRAVMRERLRSGTHVPHPGIVVRRARSVVVRCGREVPVEVDGRKAAVRAAGEVAVSVVPSAFRLLI
jgi:putative lipid kinase YegS-like protein